MSRLILIPTGQTDWLAEGRLAGDMDLPLNELGRQEASALAQAAAVHRPAVVYSGTEESTRATAKIIAHDLGLKHRATDKLREVNLGHWQGLTGEEFAERFAKVHRQWRTEPMTVVPPEGEALPAAAERLMKAIEAIRRRNREKSLAIVLGRLAYALCASGYLDGGYEHFWDHADAPASIATVGEAGAGGAVTGDGAQVAPPPE